MNTTKLVLIGLAVFAFTQLQDTGRAAQVGASVTSQAGAVVVPSKEIYGQMSSSSKIGYMLGSEWQSLGDQDDVRTCAEALSGERYAPETQTFGYAGAGYNTIRDGVFGLDC